MGVIHCVVQGIKSSGSVVRENYHLTTVVAQLNYYSLINLRRHGYTVRASHGYSLYMCGGQKKASTPWGGGGGGRWLGSVPVTEPISSFHAYCSTHQATETIHESLNTCQLKVLFVKFYSETADFRNTNILIDSW